MPRAIKDETHLDGESTGRFLAALGVPPSLMKKSTSRCSWSELQQDRATCRRAMRAILTKADGENRDLTATERAAFDLASSVVGTLTDEMDKREASGRRDGRHPGGGIVGASNLAGSSETDGMLRSNERLADRFGSQGAANVGLGHLIRANLTGDWQGLEEFRAMSGSNDPAGGFLVPDFLSSRVIDLARNASRVVQAGALTIPIQGPTTFATVEQDPVANWRAENEEIAESDMMLGSRTFTAKTLAALVRCSIELLEDAPNLSALVESSISAQLGLGLDKMCLVGNGVGKPLGLYYTPGINVIEPVGGTGALENFNLLSQAVQAVRGANAEPGAFLVSSRTSGELDRLVDANGNPLVPPRSVSEREIMVTNQIPDDLDGTSTIFTGQWSDYYIAVRTSIVLEASRVADTAFKKMQVLIRGYLRADGFAVRPNHFAAIKGIIPPT
jgi:HK97 family phage major capsid protein